tara:strand:- start:323 stop:925 length:603 start_codon:yes stop_codon:yes gene_type:complete
MIVEDEIIAAESEKRSLEELGYSVTSTVASGEKAIKKAEEDKPDLVLMDIELKGKMDGIEAAGIISSRFHIPSIFVTAYADDKILERAKITEPFGYIIKPFEKRELHSNIEMALYKNKAEEERKKLIKELQDSLAKVKQLTGLLPICANCKDIRNDKGYYEQIEKYISGHSDAEFSHGICPKCAKKLYPDIYDENENIGK